MISRKIADDVQLKKATEEILKEIP